MKSDNEIQVVQPDPALLSGDRENVEHRYGHGDWAGNDARYDDLDFDPEAEIRSQLQREEKILEHQLRDLKSDPTQPHAGQGPAVYIGFDSEYVPGTKDQVNTVLSLQFHLEGECGRFNVLYTHAAA